MALAQAEAFVSFYLLNKANTDSMRHRIIITSFLLILPLAMQLVCRARNIDSTMFLTVGGNRARLYRRILRHLYSLTTGSC